MKKSKFIGQRLTNSAGLNLPSFVSDGRRLLNSNGDIDPQSAGYQYIIDTLSYIRSNVIEQKFYEIAIADFIPVDVGEGAWMEDIIQNVTYSTGGSFFEGDIDTQTETNRIAQVGAGLDKISMAVKTWAKGTASRPDNHRSTE